METTILYIDNHENFEKAVQSLRKRKQIFIDLEFDKNHFRYGFNLCLMQIFDGDSTCYLIDPVSEIDITKIFPILEDNNIQLVCYAFNEDMRLLHHIGAVPKNILDLSIIIRLLDYDTLSLNNALATFLEDESYAVKKSSQQKSNWCLRPLSEKQKIYAKKDVIFLPELCNRLKKKTIDYAREDWVEQEMKAFENHNWNEGAVANYLTKKDKKLFTKGEWTRFKKLMKYREQLAQSLNRPTYKVFNKQIIINIAKNPKLANSDHTYKGIHPKLKLNEIKKPIQHILKEAEEQIKEEGIAVDDPSKEMLSQEEKLFYKQQRNRIQSLTDLFYLPVKEKMKRDYGVNLSNYLLSNRKIKEYASNEQELLDYQKELIVQIANQLELTLPQTLLT